MISTALSLTTTFTSSATTDMARLDWTLPVRTLIHHFQNHDFDVVSVNDGEEDVTIFAQSKAGKRIEATEIITSVDESYLRVAKGEQTAIIFIVLGNEPDELVADYGCSEELMPFVDEVVDAHRNQWEGKRCPVAA